MNKCYEMKMEGSTGVVNIFGEIGFEVDGAEFIAALDDLEGAEELKININSPGGSVFEGFSMYNALIRHPAKKTVYVNAIAASMASMLAMVGDTVVMPENSFMMIHDPRVFAGGTSKDLRRQAGLLEKIGDMAVKAYKRKSGMSSEDIKALMEAETWFTAEEAVKAGLANEVLVLESEEDIDNLESEDMKHDVYNFGKIPVAAMCYFSAGENAGDEEPQGEEFQGEEPQGEEEPTPEAEDNEPGEVENPSGESGNINPPIEERSKDMDYKDIVSKILSASEKATKEVSGIVDMASEKLGQDKAEALKTELLSGISGRFNGLNGIENVDTEAENIISEAKVKVAEMVLKSTEPVTPKIELGVEDQEKFVKMSTIALSHGAGLKVTDKEREEARKAGFLNMGLIGYCREILLRNGVRKAVTMTNGEIYDAMKALPRMAYSQGSGDFANAFEDVANKSLAQAWTNTPTTFEAWTKKDFIPDFRQKNIVRITELGDVEQIKEGEGFKWTATNDSKETATLITVGVAYGLTRKAIINDDLNALVDIPTKLSRSVKRYINRQVYTTFYGTAMAGPTMNEDSLAMFSSGHSNFVDSASGGAPSASTLSDLRRKLIKQTMPTPDGSQSNTIYTRAEPKYALYHTTLDQTMEGLVSPKYIVTGTADTVVTRDFIVKLIGVSDPVLDELMDAAGTPHYGYYLIADPADAECMGVYYLTGNEMPTMRRKNSDVAEPLGTSWDIYLDVAVGARDFRGAAANYGAAQS